MIAAPACAAAMPSEMISSIETGIAGWRSRVQAPLSAASIQTFGITERLAERLQLVDQLGNYIETALPELRVLGVEPERLEQFGMMLGAAGRQHREIALGKA